MLRVWLLLCCDWWLPPANETSIQYQFVLVVSTGVGFVQFVHLNFVHLVFGEHHRTAHSHMSSLKKARSRQESYSGQIKGENSDLLEALFRQQLAPPQDFTHRGTQQILRHSLRLGKVYGGLHSQ